MAKEMTFSFKGMSRSTTGVLSSSVMALVKVAWKSRGGAPSSLEAAWK